MKMLRLVGPRKARLAATSRAARGGLGIRMTTLIRLMKRITSAGDHQLALERLYNPTKYPLGSRHSRVIAMSAPKAGRIN